MSLSRWQRALCGGRLKGIGWDTILSALSSHWHANWQLSPGWRTARRTGLSPHISTAHQTSPPPPPPSSFYPVPDHMLPGFRTAKTGVTPGRRRRSGSSRRVAQTPRLKCCHSQAPVWSDGVVWSSTSGQGRWIKRSPATREGATASGSNSPVSTYLVLSIDCYLGLCYMMTKTLYHIQMGSYLTHKMCYKLNLLTSLTFFILYTYLRQLLNTRYKCQYTREGLQYFSNLQGFSILIHVNHLHRSLISAYMQKHHFATRSSISQWQFNLLSWGEIVLQTLSYGKALPLLI